MTISPPTALSEPQYAWRPVRAFALDMVAKIVVALP
ncbi:hypothetical protein X760_20790 [Mesorhizobium sp. LSHC422A00]|nr:hypothetical protein X760_20790 [Mesorhizobium sp. LSHC422A00]